MKVAFEEMDDCVIIRPIGEQYFKLFKGILKSTGKLKNEMKEMKEEEKKLEQRKYNLILATTIKKDSHHRLQASKKFN